jgi:hypothetical protein
MKTELNEIINSLNNIIIGMRIFNEKVKKRIERLEEDEHK